MTLQQAEEDYIYAEIEVEAAEQLLQEAKDKALFKCLKFVTEFLIAEQEEYYNGILKLCRTGR